ncbi:MAG: cytidylate kinase-like family protein [Prevotella sp.]|nr:cytidylate kinase-like family protein [Candidatus Prevotella equi]
MIICVGRQLGSGGCEIAKMLAEEFNCKYYDQELLGMAAKKSGFSEKIFEHQDESHGILKSLFNMFSSGSTGSSAFYGSSISQENLFQIQSEVIWKAAGQGDSVFVGRCADYILRKKEDIFTVFITANDEDRIATVAERLGCDKETARKYIEKKENERASYYNYYTSKKWGASQSYDICINSSLLGIKDTAKMIADIIKASRERKVSNN